jgi:hypothetical protein
MKDPPDILADIGARLVSRSGGLYRSAAGWALFGTSISLVALGVALGAAMAKQFWTAPASITLMFGAASAGSLVAGGLIGLRIGLELATKLLTVLAGASFALGLAFVPTDTGAEAGSFLLTIAVLFAIALFVTLVFEGAEKPRREL